jgi:hypothetical protein
MSSIGTEFIDLIDSVVIKTNKCLDKFHCPTVYLDYLANLANKKLELDSDAQPEPLPGLEPEDFDYPSDKSNSEDIAYDPNNEIRESDDSNDWLPSLSTTPRNDTLLLNFSNINSMVDGNNRDREVSITANTSNIEIRAQPEAEKYMLREKLKKRPNRI